MMYSGEFTRLDDLIRNELIDRWQRGERAIDSREVHARLIQDGVTIPEGAMRAVLDELHRDCTIQATSPYHREATHIHGDMMITWVDTTSM
jgi:hypothetical protein